MDIRVRRTRQSVFDALADLMLEKEVSDMTVMEVCKKAGINKSTFYLHFKNIDHCVECYFDDTMNTIIGLSKFVDYYRLRNRPDEVVALMLTELEKISDYLGRLIPSDICPPFMNMIKKRLCEAICENNGFTIEDNYEEVMSVTYDIAGCVDVILSSFPSFDKEKLSAFLIRRLKSTS